MNCTFWILEFIIGFIVESKSPLGPENKGHFRRKCSVVSIPVPQQHMSLGVSKKLWCFLCSLNGDKPTRSWYKNLTPLGSCILKILFAVKKEMEACELWTSINEECCLSKRTKSYSSRTHRYSPQPVACIRGYEPSGKRYSRQNTTYSTVTATAWSRLHFRLQNHNNAMLAVDAIKYSAIVSSDVRYK